jgi:hypothetical protein
MKRRYPLRPEPHNLQTLSERFFENCLPRDWVSETIKNDYGVDLRVDIFEDGRATGLEFLVQLKSSKRAANDQLEKIRLNLTTYNHLVNKLQVVMLVKYIEETNEAYWILLRDVPPPEQMQKTFTVYIPKANALSKISWLSVKNHVRQVTKDKLTTREQIEQIRKQFKDYLCPFCGSELTSRIDAPADPFEDDWDARESFSCGFQRFGNFVEQPCPNDPHFPRIEDYELHFSHNPEEPILKWQCFAVGKTDMARKLRLDIGFGQTQDDAKNQIIESYERYAKKKQG